MNNLNFKLYEKTISEYGQMIDQLLNDWAWESDNPVYQNTIANLKELKTEVYPDRSGRIEIEVLLANNDAQYHNKLNDILKALIIRFHYKFSSHRIEWYKNEDFLGSESYYTNIYEDTRLPNYYILHDDLSQDYKLIYKSNGKLINFRWHDLCPSYEKYVINGRHFGGRLADFDFCSTKIDLSKADFELHATATISNDKSIYENLILPFGTNVDYQYIPCKNDLDFFFSRKIISMLRDSNYGCLKLSNGKSPENEYKNKDIIDNLPF